MDPILFYWLVALAFVIVGLAGLVLPAIPGAPLLFFGLLIAAWTENFIYAGVRTLAILAVLALLTYGVDLWATLFGAKRFGASRRAIIGAVIGSIVGVFLGLPGVIFGPFIGAVIGELLAQRSVQQAACAGIGATIGLVLGAALKLALAFAMIGVFIVARFF
ncbi:MAG: DUF456 family protein [Deltaproteobacteria bacterium]|nr:DUF456 family protein [Deltaproteobacteria bacterium]MBI2180415.1 DUF456 family protein [Deltaproteobacteria bacterium]MBI2228992.1 DUF456 family protein [Deltaproteobacteria bacterium]MBI2531820.1 DUF456 family protein [Deltaproteobacteria bacterium]MBI3065528.1 DUF456 family protein [Deltaproteobacteria bacterium]